MDNFWNKSSSWKLLICDFQHYYGCSVKWLIDFPTSFSLSFISLQQLWYSTTSLCNSTTPYVLNVNPYNWRVKTNIALLTLSANIDNQRRFSRQIKCGPFWFYINLSFKNLQFFYYMKHSNSFTRNNSSLRSDGTEQPDITIGKVSVTDSRSVQPPGIWHFIVGGSHHYNNHNHRFTNIMYQYYFLMLLLLWYNLSHLS